MGLATLPTPKETEVEGNQKQRERNPHIISIYKLWNLMLQHIVGAIWAKWAPEMEEKFIAKKFNV